MATIRCWISLRPYPRLSESSLSSENGSKESAGSKSPSSEAMFLMRRKWLVIDLSIVNQKDYPITHKKKCRKDYLAAKYA